MKIESIDVEAAIENIKKLLEDWCPPSFEKCDKAVGAIDCSYDESTGSQQL